MGHPRREEGARSEATAVTNPHPNRFLELLEDTPGRVLDCGSGGRRLPGVVSLEYVYTPHADIRADGGALPFPDDSFDLALSQAVLEHVPDPQAHINELERVIRPGGLLWVEVAFLQPVHMAPFHFFNVTPHGLAHLLRGWDVLEEGTTGSLGELWEWLCRDLHAARVVDKGDRRRIRQALDAMVDQLDPVEAGACAMGVTALASPRSAVAE